MDLFLFKGILLYGPPGTGKTTFVRQLAQEHHLPLILLDRSLSNTELALLKAFEQADQLYPEKSILFLDELDTLAPKRSTHSYSNESKTVAQLLMLMDGIQERQHCLVIAATNRPNDIDPALRRPGRFDREMEFHSPSKQERLTLLQKITKDFPMDLNLTQLSELASLTNGFVAADLNLLCREAALAAVYENKDIITHAHFISAFKNGKGPSIKREYQLTLESLDWSSLGGIDDIRKELQQHIEWPYLYPKTFARLGLEPARGILLYGPPGCSKTTIAKIIASTTKASFFSMNGAQLFSAFVGASEKTVRDLFSKARMAAPSIIFLDEIESIVGSRALGDSSRVDPVRDRILSTFLNEMDGIEAAKGILVIGATNRPDMVDAALMRPGRFDKAIFVKEPDEEARKAILTIYTRQMPLSSNVDIDLLSKELTFGYTGADLKALCHEAGFEAARSNPLGFVEQSHFLNALKSISPTVTPSMRRMYSDIVNRVSQRS